MKKKGKRMVKIPVREKISIALWTVALLQIVRIVSQVIELLELWIINQIS